MRTAPKRIRMPRGPLAALAVLCVAGLASPAGAVAAPEQASVHVAQSGQLTVRLLPRTPEQIAAFYEARGFPEPMVSLLRSQCFITAIIRNDSDGIIWHDLGQWRFTTPEGPLARITRAQWKSRWARMQAPLPSQSTFRWTLLPERLDFRPGESEGGNIVLPSTTAPMTIEARFVPGPDAAGEPIRLRFEQVRCAGDTEARP